MGFFDDKKTTQAPEHVKMTGTTNQYITEDYSAFLLLPGNRHIDQSQVKKLMKDMTEKGNLIDKFPIWVNERMEVLDGQHRLEALKRLGWPVVYEVKDMTVAEVRALNSSHKNWSWRDYAISYSDLGNENYTRFLNLVQHFNLGFSIIIHYAESGTNRGRSGVFYSGEYVLKDQKRAYDLLKQYSEVSEAADHHSRNFAYAMRDVMKNENYDHKRMVEKMRKYGNRLKQYANMPDYQRAIEDIYNTWVSEDKKVRLF